MFEGHAMSWQCKKQPTIALSTIETESILDASCAKEAMWLYGFLKNLNFHQPDPITIYIL